MTIPPSPPASNQVTESVVTVEHPVSMNIESEALVVSRDKVELALYHHRDRMKARESWVAPLGVLLAALAALITSDFRKRFGLSEDTWQAVFVMMLVLSTLWLLKALVQLIRLGRKDPTEAIIEELRNHNDRVATR